MNSEIPQAEPTVNPIKALAVEIISNMIHKKQYEVRMPLQSGSLWWTKGYLISENDHAYKDLVHELGSKGYEVKYKPYRELPGDAQYGIRPICTYFKIKPSEFDKTTIIIDNDPF